LRNLDFTFLILRACYHFLAFSTSRAGHDDRVEDGELLRLNYL
jgi:hypothetical protein